MTELVKYVDVGIANEEDCQKSLGIGGCGCRQAVNWNEPSTKP